MVLYTNYIISNVSCDFCLYLDHDFYEVLALQPFFTSLQSVPESCKLTVLSIFPAFFLKQRKNYMWTGYKAYLH